MKSGFDHRPLGSAVTLVMGQAPAGSDCNRDGIGTPFVKVGEFGIERPVIREWTTDPRKMARTTDVLICVVGATCGKINLGADCAIGRSVAAIRPKVEIIDQRYLWYFMQGKVQEMRQGSQGAAQTVINREMISELLIPLPTIEKQRQVVAVLDKAFAGIATATANAQKNLTNARALFESYLSIELTTKSNDLKNQRLGEFVDVVSGAGFPKSAQGCAGEQYPFYKVSDMNIVGNEVFMERENNSISEDMRKRLGASAIPAGSIIFPKIGGAIATNKKRILTKPSCVDNNVMAVCPKSGKVDSEFLYYWLKTINISVFANDSELPSIRKPTVEDFPVKFPKEIERQRELTAMLKKIEVQAERLAKTNSLKLSALSELKQSLLQNAFAGELT